MSAGRRRVAARTPRPHSAGGNVPRMGDSAQRRALERGTQMDTATKPNENTRRDLRTVAGWYGAGLATMIAGIFAIRAVGLLLGF